MSSRKQRRSQLKPAIKILAGYAAIFGAIAVFWALDLDQITVLSVVGFASLLIIHYRISNLEEREAFTAVTDEFLAALHADPIKPRKVESDGIPAEGWGVSPEDRMLFPYFKKLAFRLNKFLVDNPFRLQEVAETEISILSYDDGPLHGRKYQIYYGSAQVGEVNFYAGLDAVYSDIRIDNARHLGYEHLMSFLLIIAKCLSRSDAETQLMKLTILSVLLGALWPEGRMWKHGPDANSNPTIEVTLSGSAAGLRETFDVTV